MKLKYSIAIVSIAIGANTALAQSQMNDAKPDVAAAQPGPSGLRGVLEPRVDGWLVGPVEAIEFKGEEGFFEQPALRPRAAVPLIDILKPEPSPDLKVKAPFAISVLFKGQTDAPIDPTTFKVLYGAFKVDITNRITKYVAVTKDGFTLEKAQIPSGKHRLTLQVQDEKQRIAERELRVEVE